MLYQLVAIMSIPDLWQKELDHSLELLLFLERIQKLERLIRPQTMLRKQVFDDYLVSMEVFLLVVLKHVSRQSFELTRFGLRSCHSLDRNVLLRLWLHHIRIRDRFP